MPFEMHSNYILSRFVEITNSLFSSFSFSLVAELIRKKLTKKNLIYICNVLHSRAGITDLHSGAQSHPLAC